MSLQVTHVHVFAWRGRIRNLGADCSTVAASGPTIWTSTYGPEPTHCNRLLIESSAWAQTVHTALYVTRDLIFMPFVECIFLFAFLCMYLRPRGVLHVLLLLVVP